MTLKVTIQPKPADGHLYPVYYTANDGVKIGLAGELTLTSELGKFRIYAPGTWAEIDAEIYSPR